MDSLSILAESNHLVHCMSETVKILGKLAHLSRFSQFVNPENLAIGLNVWIRSSGIHLIISVALHWLGLLNQMGSAGMLVLMIINFALLQWAVSSEAQHRFSIAAPAHAWFSVFWRVLVYSLPVTFLLVSLMVDTSLLRTQEITPELADQMLKVQLILLIFTIIPTGISTSQTLRNHLVSRIGRSDGIQESDSRNQQQSNPDSQSENE